MQNAITWFEIPTTQLERAQAFYEKLLGRPMNRQTMDTSEMAIFAYEPEAGVGGALTHYPEAPQPSAHGTVVYLDAMPSIGAALERAVAQGARVVIPRTPLPPGMGFFAHIVDLDGNRVGLHAAQ
ncbi:VOC family protein [Acidovorax sp. sic0104]|uniref:VOC family protein n=1 Tax=Acidovorax sp. sic0104 TaxID=2854784 RepID=UPI001C445C23|nr:VOC family protein [Acidovorax sp. sic0104]MBV7544285.1 VOC family protein [Acidovorax sp. sic0104]